MISNGVKSLLHSPSEQSELAEIMFWSDCVSVCAQWTGQSAVLNVYSFKTVKAMDFRFDTRVFRDSPDMILKIYGKWAWPGSRDLPIFGH